jgi:hypothetical protein
LVEGLIRTWLISSTRVLLLGNICDFDDPLVLGLEVFGNLLVLKIVSILNLPRRIECTTFLIVFDLGW